MRAVMLLLTLGACGRISFDARNDGGDGAGDGDAGRGLPLTCGETFSPVSVNIAPDSDLVVGALPSGLAVAWLDRSQKSTPFLSRVVQQQLIGPLLQSPLSGGTALGSLATVGSAVYLHSSFGAIQTLVKFDATLGNETAYDNATGMLGRDCVTADVQTGTGVAIVADVSTLYGHYFGATSLEPDGNIDTGTPIASLACQPGSDHTHVGWATSGNECSGMQITHTPTAPTFNATTLLSTDCRSPRFTMHDPAADTTGAAWETTAGGVETAYIFGSTAEPMPVSTSGRSPRVASTGTQIWVAWTDTRAAEPQLQVGHRTPSSTLTHAALDGVVPAGPEAYELIRVGETVYLVVLSAADGGITFFSLCTSP